MLIFISFIANSSELPNSTLRGEIIEDLAKEMTRLDGDGLVPRSKRSESWDTTVKKLIDEAKSSNSKLAFGRVIERLDSTYPNLHAKVVLNKEYSRRSVLGRPKIAASFAPEVVQRDQRSFIYRIDSVKQTMLSKLPQKDWPKDGDILLSINGRPIEEWMQESFIFCKFPLHEQCADEVWQNFWREQLSWTRDQVLTYKLKRDIKIWDISIPVETPIKENNQKEESITNVHICDEVAPLYENYSLVHRGLNACIFENNLDSSKTIWKIASFR
jgi:hypothetical protein